MAEVNRKKIKLGTLREWTRIDPEGHFVDVIEVPYEINGAHYFVTINKEGATPESIEAAVKEDAKKYMESTGKTITF